MKLELPASAYKYSRVFWSSITLTLTVVVTIGKAKQKMEIKLYLQLLATLLTLAMIHGKLIVLVFPFHFYQNLVVLLFITLS